MLWQGYRIPQKGRESGKNSFKSFLFWFKVKQYLSQICSYFILILFSFGTYMLKTYFHRECSSEMISCTIYLLKQNWWVFLKTYAVPSLSIIACVKRQCLKTRGSVGWACVAHFSFCFQPTLHRTFHRFFLPNFGSFRYSVSEEIFY